MKNKVISLKKHGGQWTGNRMRKSSLLRSLMALLLTALLLVSCIPCGYAAATPRRAVITVMEGSVLVQAAGQATAVPARKGIELKSGDRIITGKDGSCTIRYDDGCTTHIGPNSRVDMTNLTRQGADGPNTTILGAQRGTLWNNAKDVMARNSRFEVNTPSAIAAVRGTFFRSIVLPNGDTLFVVLGGGLYISPAGSDGDDDVPPPSDEGVFVGSGQQLGVSSDEELPDSAVPLDYDNVDDITLSYLAEDNPDIFVELIEGAAAQGETEFLERVNQLLEDNENMQQNLGDKLEKVKETVKDGTSQPPPSPDDGDYDDSPALSTITASISNPEGITIPVGASGSVDISFSPADVTVTAVSSNPDVATVTVEEIESVKCFDITGVSAGTATITVTAGRTGYYTKTMSFPVIVAPEPQKMLEWGAGSFFEDPDNNGTIGTGITVSLTGETFAMTSGIMDEDEYYTAANVPEGLSVEITVTDSTHALIELTGAVTSHAAEDSISDLTITFLDAAFNGGSAEAVAGSSNADLGVEFTDWTTVGSPGFSDGAADYINLQVSYEVPYVAYSSDDQIYVQKYNSEEGWDDLCLPINANGVSDISLYADDDYCNGPYVAYNDSSGVWVKVRDWMYEDLWDTVGNDPVFNTATDISLYVKWDTPYLAYSDSGKATVAVAVYEEVYDSGLGWDLCWHDVGVFDNAESPVSLYIDEYTSYVAYSDASLGGKATVKVGEQHSDPDLEDDVWVWNDVSNDPVSENAVSHVSIYSFNGTPFVAYREQATGDVKVARFDGEWVDTALSVSAAASPVSLTGTHSSHGLFMSYLDTEGKARVMGLLPDPENLEGPPQWKCLGGPVSEGQAGDVSLAVLEDYDEAEKMVSYRVFVAFKDLANEGRVTVKEYCFQFEDPFPEVF